MSFFHKILCSLGLANDNLDEPQLQDTDADSAPEAIGLEAIEPSTDNVTMIFDHVVAIFNESLPGFLAKSVDPEKQKQELYDALDADLKRYVEAISQATQAKCREAWGVEHDKMKAEADELRQKAMTLEAKRSELNDRQLSSDRQKRALSERVHDLESKVLSLEAEKEQLELENKSLINKAKVANVQETELEELRSALASASKPAGSNAAEVDDLKAQIDALKQELESKTAEIEKATASLKAAEAKDGISDAMVAEYQKKASEAVANAKKAQERIDEMQQKLSVADARIDDFKKGIASKETELESVTSKLQKAEARLANSITQEEAQSIIEQVDAFAEIRERLDSQIGALNDKLRASQEENESLRHTIHNNLLEHSRHKQELMREIEELKKARTIDISADIDQEYNPDDSDTKQKSKQKKKAKPETTPIDDIDNLLQGSDWLVSTPPKGTSMRTAEDEAFGYQPPQKKKPMPSTDSQPSLFDNL